MPQYEVLHEEVAPEGVYPFTVTNAEEKQSKNGNAMIELQLQFDVPGKNGGIRAWDRLVFASGSTWRIDAFRIATGEKLVEGPGSFEPEDCIDRQGKARLMIETYQGRDRNRVEEYIDPASENPAPEKGKKVDAPDFAPPSLEEEFKAKAASDTDDDEIPMR